MLAPDQIEHKLKAFFKRITLSEETLSTVLGGLVLLLVFSFIFSYYQDRRTNPQISNQAASTTATSSAQTKKVIASSYTIQQGENLWQIAEELYGDGELWIRIAEDNNLPGPDYIEVGQELTLPTDIVIPDAPEETPIPTPALENNQYLVQPGDTLQSIAVAVYNDETQWEAIARANNIVNRDLLLVGIILEMPE
jgi:nucleoid-associated protein YgaU